MIQCDHKAWMPLGELDIVAGVLDEDGRERR